MVGTGPGSREGAQAWDRGGTKVCIQGGLHPKMEGKYYRELVLTNKSGFARYTHPCVFSLKCGMGLLNLNCLTVIF